jgi:hypothetical protein
VPSVAKSLFVFDPPSFVGGSPTCAAATLQKSN